MAPILIVDGDDANNYLYGGDAAEVMNGKGGDDVLNGGGGDDTLDGGSGRDILMGGTGNNTFRWGRGSGQDAIDSYSMPGTGAGRNVLQLGEGVTPSDLRLSQQGDTLLLNIKGSGDELAVLQFFNQRTGNNGEMLWGYQVSEMRFADGTRWDMAAIQTQLKLSGPPLIVLGEQNDNVYGPALDGAGGDDMLLGAGPSLLIGGSGNDTLVGSPGADVLLGGSGDDSLSGGLGNDFLDGGAGNDQLNGEGGFDTYRFGYGSGQDTIVAPKYGQGDVLTIDMGPAVQAGTLGVLRTSPSSPDLVLELPMSGERLTVKDYFAAPRNVSIHFADGSTMNKPLIDLRAMGGMPINTVSGGDASEYLYGTYNSDILRGGGGNDTLVGADGDDLLAGGDGNDVLDAAQGNDIVDGGAGDDRIMGGSGATTMLFGRNSGHDELFAPRAGGAMTVLLEAGIGAADIGLVRSDNGQGPDLMINVGGFQAGIRVSGFFIPMQGEPDPAVALQFADGTVWDRTLLTNLLLTGNDESNMLQGTMGNDRMDGRGGNDMLNGFQGNDLLLGGSGSDTLLGGEGDDTLNGGQGDDYLDDSFGNNTYVFSRGDGRDIIFNNTKMPEQRYQSIAFTDGITPDQVHLQRLNRGSWDDLVLTVDGAPGQEITVQGYVYKDPMYATNMQLKEIRFADGSKWDAAAIVQRLNQGTDMGEMLSGTDGNDYLDGRGGDDVLFGKGGNDTLVGGRGFDQLDGGPGVDTYVFNLGDGRDQLVDVRESGAAANVIRFGAGIAPQDLRVAQFGSSLEIAYGSGGDSIVLGNNEANLPAGQQTVERIEFADGSVRSLGDYRNHAPVLMLPVPDQAVAPGQQFKLTLPSGTFVDPDAGDMVRLMMSQVNGAQLPSWLSFDAVSNTLQGVAPLGVQASYPLRVTAKDVAGLHATDDFILTVGGANSAPSVKSPSAGLLVSESKSFGMLTPTFTDPDAGDALTVKVTMAGGAALPSWLWFDGKDWLTGVTGYDTAGSYKLTATATDKGGLSVSSNFDLVVSNVNRAPLPLRAVGTLEAAQGTPFASTLPAKSLVDPDGGALSYKLTQMDGTALPAWLAFDAQSQTLSGTPAAGAASALSLVLTGTDSGGLAGSTFFKLNIAADATLALSGSAGNDVLGGLSAGDTLLGLAGDDQLNGFGGNDVLDGGLGADRMAGGAGNDRYLVDSASDAVLELANEGRDTVLASVGYTLPANAEVLVLNGSAALAGYGNGSDNVLYGNVGNNFLNGNGGNDVLQGGAGNDSLVDALGRNVFDGGAGADTLSGGSGVELFIGGTGNDIINTGSGIDIIAFNRGDGSDMVNPSSGLDNVISLGGIAYADLVFKKSGSDLILGTGAAEQITLKGWYTPNMRSVAKLQVFIENTADFQPGSPLSMNSQKIQLFNFDALVSKFDQALLANPALASWSLAPELAGAWLTGGRSTAVGGDLAQQYATAGTLANVAQVPALAIIGANAFGDANHFLGTALSLADGSDFLM